jgi:diadenosine tetraphosphate (Ap4A) HIT family hydrolase
VTGESAEQLYERARAAAAADGRLAMPPVHEWETFPFEGEIRVRPLVPPVAAEPSRRGEGGVGCWRCERGDSDAIWSDERWLLAPLEKPTGLPAIVILQPRAHHDLDDLPEELAGELGPLIQRVERAVRAVENIGRVHVCRWGDGSEHLHFWFMARPARLPQVVGSFAAIWDDILPPLPEAVWRANLRVIAETLAAVSARADGL